MEAQKVSLATKSIFGSKKRGDRLGKKRPKVAKIAIVGDQGLGSNSRKVLQMVSDFGADLLLIPGDFDYQDSPSSFMHQITDVLGKSFPVIAAPGNHDILMWFSENGYRDLLLKQAARSGLKRHCFGDYGINSACLLGDVLIVQSGVGTLGTDHASWIDKTFARYWDVPWKICMWHKNQKNLQTGDKQDETGYLVYETCRKHGAMIFTGHEHSYERTFLLSNFESQEIVSRATQLDLSPGHSFAAVVGLGGDSIRPWRYGLEQNPWWAAKAALDNGVDYGGLLCTLELSRPHDHDNDHSSRTGSCFFQDINGVVWDNFTMTTPEIMVAPRIDAESSLLDRQYQERPLIQAHSSSLAESYSLAYSRKHRHHFDNSDSFNSSMMPARKGIIHSMTFRLYQQDLKARQIFLQMMLVTFPRAPVTGSIRISVQRHDWPPSLTLSSIIRGAFDLLSLQASSTTIWSKHFFSSPGKSIESSVTIESGEVWVSANLAPLLDQFTLQEDSLVTFDVEASFPGSETFIYGITDALQTCAAPVLSVLF